MVEGTEVALAGEGQEVFVATVFAFHAGKSLVQVTMALTTPMLTAWAGPWETSFAANLTHRQASGPA